MTMLLMNDTALRRSRYFGNAAKFWLGLQVDFDIGEEEKLKSGELEIIALYQSSASWQGRTPQFCRSMSMRVNERRLSFAGDSGNKSSKRNALAK